MSSTGADYVFDSGYHLAALNEVAAYISEHHHLPDIPSASEVQQKGANVGEMQSKLLAKIEELTLHMIQAEERNNRLEQQNRDLSNGFPGWSRREAKLPGTNRHDRNGLHPLARLAVAPLVFIDRSLPD